MSATPYPPNDRTVPFFTVMLVRPAASVSIPLAVPAAMPLSSNPFRSMVTLFAAISMPPWEAAAAALPVR
jgi:hypothetical protein